MFVANGRVHRNLAIKPFMKIKLVTTFHFVKIMESKINEMCEDMYTCLPIYQCTSNKENT